MYSNIRLLLVAGARPNFMKIAPLVKAIASYNDKRPSAAGGVEYRLVHTGQHYDASMSEVFFRELDIPPPDYNLEVGSDSHAAQTANIMLRFEPICRELHPDWLVVVGDVNSTMACSLVAAKMGVRIAHVEAGLRSHDRGMPEEINRLVTDVLADLLLTPSEDADQNLLKEGHPHQKIRRVGNIMIDALMANIEKSKNGALLDRLGLVSESYVYVTLHRPSNVDDRESLSKIMTVLQRISHRLPIVFPMHPRTRTMLDKFEIRVDQDAHFQIIEPIGYHDSLCLSQNARFVLTDSGGLQEETTFFRTPCLTLRPNTERPVTVTIGSNRLTSLGGISEDIERTMQGPKRIGQVPPLWDGKSSERILKVLVQANPSGESFPDQDISFISR